MGLTLTELVVTAGGGALDGLKVSAPVACVPADTQGIDFVFWILEALLIAQSGEATNPGIIKKTQSYTTGTVRTTFTVTFTSELNVNSDWVNPRLIQEADDPFA